MRFKRKELKRAFSDFKYLLEDFKKIFNEDRVIRDKYLEMADSKIISMFEKFIENPETLEEIPEDKREGMLNQLKNITIKMSSLIIGRQIDKQIREF